MQGFKAFVLRGNLVELAVAFVMGTAFALVVTTFTTMLMGFIGKIGGQPDFTSVTLAGVNVGKFITALISFLIVAAVVYFFVVLPYTKAKERFFPSPEPEGTPEDVALLTEIRDLLSSRP
ncbi:MAG: large conductance mechanosensitive channel [Nocardioidaceae bacterium]|jgi:large conductance mechanosensitive channel|nr:large conductance mechanosensitive channel [Nocardioidaceae bacterium]